MIVVSDTSPLTNLAAIGQLGLLARLYGDVYIPMAVWDELNAAGRPWPGRDQVVAADWVHRHTVKDRALMSILQRDLDRGESEAIALALELRADVGSAPRRLMRVGRQSAAPRRFLAPLRYQTEKNRKTVGRKDWP